MCLQNMNCSVVKPIGRLAAVKFRITIHSGFAAPRNALDLLSQRLGAGSGGARFTPGVSEIKATLDEDPPVSMESDEREQIGRLAVLEIVREVCERSPDLKLDWFAVSARRY
jgi:hypothetical protein